MPPNLTLRPPPRDRFVDGLKRSARRGVLLVDRSGTGRRLVTAVLAERASRHGAHEVLLARGEVIRHQATLRSAISYYRLLVAVSKGDLGRLSSLLRHLGPVAPQEDEMWAVFSLAGLDVEGLTLHGDREHLIRDVAAPIEREIETTGASTLLHWLIRNDVYRLDDHEFRDAVNLLIDTSITRRQAVATHAPSDDVLSARRALTRILATVGQELGQPVFASGPTLRDETNGRFDSDPTSMEFGSFGACADLARASKRAGLDVESWDESTLIVVDPDRRVSARVGRYIHDGPTTVHSDGALTRWHTGFGVTAGSLDGTPFLVPTETGRHLTERFGPGWEMSRVFFDDVFDSPNSTYDHSLRALFDVYRRVRDSFASGDRFVAAESSRRLRDRFGIDFAMFIPQPVHHKVVSLPLSDRPVRGSTIAVMAGAFELLDARTIMDLDRIAANDRIVVAAVRDTPGSNAGLHRMTTVKTLRSVDHVLLYTSTADLVSQLEGFDPDELLIRSDAGLRESETRRPGMSVVTDGDWDVA